MYDQVVESCDCVDEETECSDARVQGEERIQQMLSVAGNGSEQFAIGVIADTGESYRMLSPVTYFVDFRRNASKQFLSSAEANPHQAGDA